jgi:outer membrane protein OmpA-like peptidoglycan-associated protein
MTIHSKFDRALLAGVAAAMLVAGPAFAAKGDTKLAGLITAHTGNTLTVVDANNVSQTITLTPGTVVKSVAGVVGAQKKTVEQSALISGLRISAEGVDSGSGFAASKIEFKTSDFKTAQAVGAGVAQTQAQANANTAGINANKNRMDDFGTNETLATTDVLFASGSTVISPAGKTALNAFAAKAKATKGYQVVINGYTDSTGNAEQNQRLSKARANAVINYLQQTAGLSTARVQSGNGMGVAADAGAGSNGGARKVTARLFVDKGVADGTK